MSMDGSGSREVGVNSFHKDALFTLWFHLINLCLLGAGVYGDDQGIANKEEAENTGIGRADKPGTAEQTQKKTQAQAEHI